MDKQRREIRKVRKRKSETKEDQEKKHFQLTEEELQY
jgi:hypothetical protein